MSSTKRQADLDQFDPEQFDVNFSSESDVSMSQSVRSTDKYKDDKKMVEQLSAISSLMKKLDDQLAMKKKLLDSDVGLELYRRKIMRLRTRRLHGLQRIDQRERMRSHSNLSLSLKMVKRIERLSSLKIGQQQATSALPNKGETPNRISGMMKTRTGNHLEERNMEVMIMITFLEMIKTDH